MADTEQTQKTLGMAAVRLEEAKTQQINGHGILQKVTALHRTHTAGKRRAETGIMNRNGIAADADDSE